MRQTLLICLICLVVSLVGCGGRGLLPTGGKVTFEDGSPLTKGTILFSTGSYQAEGEIKPDGTYVLTSLKPGDGLPEGKYQVLISSSETDANEKTIQHVDPKFADPATSGLTAEVTKGGKNQFDFKVAKPAK